MAALKMSQKELRRHLAQVLAKNKYDRESFGRAAEEYLDAHPVYGQVSDRVVKWTTPGVWTRFLDNTFAEYWEWREVFVLGGGK